jgi:hypothetical protein
MLEKLYTSIIVVFCILLFICLVVAYNHDQNALEKYENKMSLIKRGIMDKNTRNYKAFMLELKSDLETHKISLSDKEALNKLANKIMFEEITGQKSIFKKVSNACILGLVQGGVTGFLTGGMPGMLGGSLVFGTTMPILTTYKELNPLNENLV